MTYFHEYLTDIWHSGYSDEMLKGVKLTVCSSCTPSTWMSHYNKKLSKFEQWIFSFLIGTRICGK